MSELSFEQMLEDSVKTIRNGEIVQGTVIDVKEDEIILNIGYKADGIITKSEYSNDASLVLNILIRRPIANIPYIVVKLPNKEAIINIKINV